MSVSSYAQATMPLQQKSRKAKVWMYDVDGVLVSLISKCADISLLDALVEQLLRGDIVTFNSGRSPMAIAQLVLFPLAQRLADMRLLSRVMIVGEKGGAWATSTAGALQINYEASLRVPLELKSAVAKLIKDPNFDEILEIERGKRTMVSVVKKRHVSLDVFQQVQARFVPVAQQCLCALGLDRLWKIDVVSDAIEIEPVSADKGKGAHRILHWLHDQGIRPTRIVAIEDSPSGIAMAEVIHQRQIPVEFVFVNSCPLPLPVYPFPVIRTELLYEQGTLEYLARPSHVCSSQSA